MPDKNIFCNVPWTNFHMYHDGSFGVCCYESTTPYDSADKTEYSIQNMSIGDWYNSNPMKQTRIDILGHQPLKICSNCYHDESFNYESRRIRENYKTVIFHNRFERSYQQSHWFDRFESAKNLEDQTAPIDWHIDLSNECNLACKMCNPRASSKIAANYKQWGLLLTNYKRDNWTDHKQKFDNFLNNLDQAHINRLHFMGGEPLLNKKFKLILDYLISNNRTDISVSFVSNGTVVDQTVLDNLKKFRSADVEISIESVSSNNHYIRQGCDTKQLIENILYFKSQQTETFKLVLRTVPQLLSINTYDSLVLWAWENNLPIVGIPLNHPSYLAANLLPDKIKKVIINRLYNAKAKIQSESTSHIKQLSISRDISRLSIHLSNECSSLIEMLEKPNPPNAHELRTELIGWLNKWDKIYNLNAIDFYPEYADFLRAWGYEV